VCSSCGSLMPSRLAPETRSTARPPEPARASEDEPIARFAARAARAASENAFRRPMARHFPSLTHVIVARDSGTASLPWQTSLVPHLFLSISICVQCARATGHEQRQRLSIAFHRPGETRISSLSRGRATRRVARGALSRCVAGPSHARRKCADGGRAASPTAA
jgi:hypothetical protein